MKTPLLYLVPLFLVALPLRAQTLILESDSAEGGPVYCDQLHDPKSCSLFHYDNPAAPTAGSTIQLEGESYVVDWIGPGYYLETGVIIEPLPGEHSDLKGQLWLEIYPDRGAIHTSHGWTDKDGNQALSPSDILVLDSEPGLRIEDVRLQLRVRPVR